VSLHLDGTPSWHWRPRRSDTHDLDFGAVPNLFTITVNGKRRAVVGAGGKDGTYYVIDRDGVNRATGVRWDDADPSSLPYPLPPPPPPAAPRSSGVGKSAVSSPLPRSTNVRGGSISAPLPAMTLTCSIRSARPCTRSTRIPARSSGRTPPSQTPTRALRPRARFRARCSWARTSVGRCAPTTRRRERSSRPTRSA